MKILTLEERYGPGTVVLLMLAGAVAPTLAKADPPHVVGGTEAQRGEYLVAIAGCNDCYTPGWMEHPGEILPAQRLTGSAVGWQGPRGTSFPTNLRLRVADMSAGEWVKLIDTFHPLPPMPDYNVRSMSKSDRLAIFAYIKSLGSAGEPAPAALPPGTAAKAPFFSLNLPVPSPGK